MKKGLVSVIIPVYNTEKYLAECLDSLAAQTFTDFEAIIVDDGSTDGSPAICDEYAARDPRFRVIHKQNGGASSARNVGLDAAKGEYLFFLDSDDRIREDTLNKSINAAKEKNADLVFFEAEAFDDESGKRSFSNYSYRKEYCAGEPSSIMTDMLAHREFHVVIWNLLVSHDLFINNALRFKEGIMYEDMILSYQIWSLAHRAAHLHEVLYERRVRANSVMTSRKTEKNFRSANEVYYAVKEFAATLPADKKNERHLIRCAYNALNDYRCIDRQTKKKYREKYNELKRDILSENAFGDEALKSRCRGYYLWAIHKAVQKLFTGEKYELINYSRLPNAPKKVMLVMPQMVGGGAERVAAQLINKMRDRGIDTRFLLTSAKRQDVVRCDLDERTPLILASEDMPKPSTFGKAANKAGRFFTSLLCKPFELVWKQAPAPFAAASVKSQYKREISFVRSLLKAEPDLTVIAFLQPAIPITLLAARGLPNRVIISERADPNRLMKKRYGRRFVERYYPRADAAVFQTGDAKAVYPASVASKGTVIPNPLKEGLPAPYHGERNKNITTFCRISNQKNLPLLIEAFAKLHGDRPDYSLRIIGDAPNSEGEDVLRSIKEMIAGYGIGGSVIFEPFSAEVHAMIIKDAMYVNSSDYEGISNAMLEAMAIGMPSVCTDCPIGGARATITDGENGLLVPIRDPDALYRAMKCVVEEPELAEKLSQNASKLRDELSLERITERWMELI